MSLELLFGNVFLNRECVLSFFRTYFFDLTGGGSYFLNNLGSVDPGPKLCGP